MSTIALVWIDSIHVGNSTAKSFLRYLATHNFHKPGFFFKNATYMKALEISKKTLERAFEHLEKNNFITIERRFDENGRQIPNGIYLNIPQEFIDNYEKMIQGEGVKNVVDNYPVKMTPLGASKCPPPPRQNDAPYNNNINNNKSNNKREREKQKRASLSPFHPSEQNTLLCKDYGLDLKQELESFMNRHKGEKTQYEFRRWLENGLKHKSITRNAQSIQQLQNQTRCEVPEWGPGHPSYDSIYGLDNKSAQGLVHDNRTEISGDKPRSNNLRKVESYLL